jgi:hypothetical protein
VRWEHRASAVRPSFSFKARCLSLVSLLVALVRVRAKRPCQYAATARYSDGRDTGFGQSEKALCRCAGVFGTLPVSGWLALHAA